MKVGKLKLDRWFEFLPCPATRPCETPVAFAWRITTSRPGGGGRLILPPQRYPPQPVGRGDLAAGSGEVPGSRGGFSVGTTPQSLKMPMCSRHGNEGRSVL